MKIDGKRLIEKFEQYCPQWLAESGDPVGLQIGTLDKTIKVVMVTLDVRPEVVAEAIANKVDLLIAKHPPIFRPVKQLNTDIPQNKMYADLLKHDIAVYVAHTNLDIIENGLNDWFCERLGIQNTTYLTKTHEEDYQKLIVSMPITVASQMKEALVKVISETKPMLAKPRYPSDHLFMSQTTTPLMTTDKIKREESEKAMTIEVLFPTTKKAVVIQTVLNTHPEKEIIYDIYPCANQKKKYGIGRIGQLKEPIPLNQFVTVVKKEFQLDGLRIVTSDDTQLVQTIAICGGSGEKFFREALKKQADVYITGDVYYHTAHDMMTEGLSVIDPGHYIEELCKSKVVQLLNQWKEEEEWECICIASQVNTNPFQFK